MGLCPASGSTSEKTEWVFTQHQLHKGDIKVFVCRDGVRIVNQRNRYELISRAPDWTVCCFRKDERLIWKITLDKFRGLDVMSFMGTEKKTPPLQKVGEAEITGIKADVYLVGHAGKRKITLACANDMDIAPQALEAICVFFNLPVSTQMPLELHEVEVGKQDPIAKSVTWFNLRQWHEDLTNPLVTRPFFTVSRQKVRYNNSDFTLPPGLTPVERYQSILFSRGQKDQIETAIPELGFEGDYSEKKKGK